MIKIYINHASNQQISLLEVKGHAGSAEYGKDLVCAGVSAVVIGGLNNLKNISSYEIKIEEGYVLFKSNVALDQHDEIVLETIVCGLQTIYESNQQFIEIKTDI